MEYIAIFSLILSLHCPWTTQSIDYRTLKIDDDRLLEQFKKADNCVKIEIVKYFKKDIAPIAKGHSNELIRQLEEITKTKATRDGTFFGYVYDDGDFDNDIQTWTRICDCNK